MTALIRNAAVVSMNGRREIFEGADILVEAGRIAKIGLVEPQDIPVSAEIVDASGQIVLPGFVDAHVHTSQQLGRGIADDVDLLTWLRDRIWPFESHLTPDDQHLSTLALGVEMIRSGVTTFSEAGGQHVDEMGRARCRRSTAPPPTCVSSASRRSRISSRPASRSASARTARPAATAPT